jgi:hypothetical protein
MRNIFTIIIMILLTSFGRQDLSAQKKVHKNEVNITNKDQNHSIIVNFNQRGNQITRFDSATAAIDAHDGEIALFNGVYYLYGTSYDCGFEWGNKASSFCGFKTYSSDDLVNWTDRGFLFDAQTTIWQCRCNGSTYGCFRPHVIYNQASNLYVLWINVYDNRVGFRVFTSKTPTGPFSETAIPTLAVNSDGPVAGLNNGDHDTFVDDDGIAYIAYTDWRTNGTIVVEKLSSDYLSGTGICVKTVTPSKTEAPSLFKRKGIYYLLYSDPNCGYCSGTGTSYRMAASPLGPWSDGTNISKNSCGGQPSFVSVLKQGSDTIFLYGSDLWNNAAKNEALANYYWAPLSFASDGSINPIICQDTICIGENATKKQQIESTDLDNSSGTEGFENCNDILDTVQRSQSFVATRSGTLTKVYFTTFKNGYPDSMLNISIYKANKIHQPLGDPLNSMMVSPDSLGWAPKRIIFYPNIHVIAGKRYAIIIKSASSKGTYGFEYTTTIQGSEGGSTFSTDSGKKFILENNKMLMFQTFIRKLK